jgi:hypothetical protein
LKITRNLIREYYGIPAESTVEYFYINTGFIKCAEDNNPKVDKTAFVGDVNVSCAVTGYENGWEFEAQYVKGDPVVDDLAQISQLQKIGADCERSLVSVDMASPVEGETDTYAARKFAIIVEATPPTGDPKSIAKLEGTFHQSGDLTRGTFNVATRAFTQAL